jgi:RNA 3'-terminal phosphate cyclase (ATP)
VIQIDGSRGEGGGQILRSSLSLSIATGRDCRIFHIRAGRKKPGLRRQHLTALRAAAETCGAQVEGAAIGSQEVVFRPGKVRAGRYRFAVGTAGSATLVLQTVLPALLTADEPSEFVLEGGTHNPWSPPFDFLARTFLPTIEKMGPRVTAELQTHGFYPAGGGRFRVVLEPIRRLAALSLPEREGPVTLGARALVSSLPVHIAEREIRVVQTELGIAQSEVSVGEVEGSIGPGNVVMVEARTPGLTEVFTGFGCKGVRAEKVAHEVVEEVRAYLDAGAPVGKHLADQLLLPMALAGGGAFRTAAMTPHTRTNIEVIRVFLDVDVRLAEDDQGVSTVEISG